MCINQNHKHKDQPILDLLVFVPATSMSISKRWIASDRNNLPMQIKYLGGLKSVNKFIRFN